MNLILPTSAGALQRYDLSNKAPMAPVPAAPFNRVAYAAAHVVIDPVRSANPWDAQPVIDWEATLRFREYLYGLGFKVAEAMDTAQRGMGLDWSSAQELIRRSLRHARTIPGADLACGAGTDHLQLTPASTLDDVVEAYREQFAVVEGEGGRAIMMASRALCKLARGADDYLYVYDRILSEVRGPVILHWLGDMFDPALAGYWGADNVGQAMETVLLIIQRHAAKIEGIKISLLETRWECALRARLPQGVAMYTGDDFNYGELIAGDGSHHSHALLGIFDPIAPVAARALHALAAGHMVRYQSLMAPTVALSREMFRAPTRHYKAGVVFLAWLNGHQDHFSMVAGLQSARGALHYAELFRLADAAGVLIDPELAVSRMRGLMQVLTGNGA
ncbi:MAG: dihydrodipicolinate synthase family protein [Pseudomonadota bacterium]